MFLVYWAYPIVCEALWGRTLGKRALGLRVLARDGAPVGWMAAITATCCAPWTCCRSAMHWA